MSSTELSSLQGMILTGFGVMSSDDSVSHKIPIEPQQRTGFGKYEDSKTSQAPEPAPAKPKTADTIPPSDKSGSKDTPNTDNQVPDKTKKTKSN